MLSLRVRTVLSGIVLLASGLGGTPARAAPPDDPLPQLRETWRWVTFREDAGLPSRDVLRVLSTDDGTVWAGTSNGVAWYDGFVWRPPGDPESAPPGRVTALVPRPGGGIYALIEQRVFRCTATSVTRVAVDDVIWVGRANDRVVVHSELGMQALGMGSDPPQPLPEAPEVSDHVSAWPAGSNRILLGSSSGLYALGEGVEQVVRVPGGAPVHIGYAVEFPGGEGFASVESPMRARGLWRWVRGRPAEHVNPSLLIPAHAIDVAPDGTVLVAYDSGALGVRLPGESTWREAVAPPEVQGARCMYFGPRGDLWVGTSNGLNRCRLSDDRWERRSLPPPDVRNAVESLSVGPDGSIWAGTPAGVVRYSADGTVRSIDPAGDAPLRDVTGIAHDSRGHLWIGSGSSFTGAFRYDGAAWRHFGAEDGLLAERVHQIRALPGGDLWLLGIGASGDKSGPGAFRRIDGDRFERVRPPGHPEFSRVYDLVAGTQGELWFGTRHGVARLRDDVWTTWNQKRLLGMREAFAVTLGHDGTLWLGDRRGGVGSIAPDGTVRRHGVEDGLVDPRVWGLATDPQGGIWATTEGGLGRFFQGSWTALSPKHGLPSARCWPIVSTPDRVVVGTNGHGVVALRLEGDQQPPRTQIFDPIVEDGTALVRWRSNAFSGAVAAEAIPTRHRLDDGPWSDWSTRREVALRGLGAGDHTVEVQAKGFLGRISDPPAAAQLRVEPSLPLQPVFLVPIGVLTAALVGLALIAAGRRRKDRGALVESERHLREILDNANDIVFTQDLRGRILSLNPAGAVHLGMSLTERPEMRVQDLLSPEGLEAARAVGEQLAAQDGSVTYETEVLTASGERRALEVAVRMLSDDGRPARVLGIARDVSERKRIASELHHAQKLEAVGKLTGGIAHDFNNILAAIMVSLELLKSELGPDHPCSELTGELLTAAERGGRLTRQLLAFSSRQELRPETLQLRDVVDQMAGLLRRTLGTHVEVEVHHAEDACYCLADAAQLQNVLLNLAVNSRDAMLAGGTLTIRTATAVVGPDDPAISAGGEPGEYALLRVQDTGTGMPADVAIRAFEPFFTTKSLGQGTGLGLSMVYGFVKQSGGHVSIASSPGGGTTVDVLLPRSRSEPSPPEPAAVATPRGGGQRVLLIEDEDALRSLFGTMLAHLGYEVTSAEDGESALRAFANGSFDVVLSDVMLKGGLSGPEVIRRARPTDPDVPVVFMSGQSSPPLAEFGLDARTCAFLAKPFRMDGLAAALRTALGERAS